MAQTDFARLIIEADSRQVKGATKDLSSLATQSGKTERGISSLSTGFRGLFVAAGGTYAISQLVSGFNNLADAGSDLYEAINKGSVVLGQSFNDVERFANTSSMRLGQTKQEAIDAASTFGIFGKSAGLAGKGLSDFSIQFTELASDFASFYNTSPQDAITAIGAAFRGEAEPIRKYGILMDDATLKQIALKEGIISTTKGALTPQQKVLAASKLIMEQSADAQGDFARTSNGLANQQRINKALWKDISAEIGSKFIPISSLATEVSIGLGNAIKSQIDAFKVDKITKYRDEIDNLSKSYNTLTTAYGSFSVISNTVIRTQDQINKETTDLSYKISELSNSYNQATASYQNYVKAQKEEEGQRAAKAAEDKAKRLEEHKKYLERMRPLDEQYHRSVTAWGEEAARLDWERKQEEIENAKKKADEKLQIEKAYIEEGKQLTKDMRTEEEALADEMTRIIHLYDQSAISAETYNRAITSIKEQQDALNESSSFWGDYLESMEANMLDMDKIVGDTLSNMSAKFGQFFADAIWDSDNLGDSFKKMAIGLGKSMTAAVGEMIAQWVVMAITKKAISAATTAASVAEAAVVASAWAPAAAAVSLASFGANAAPAGAGIAGTYALASGLSLAGMAKDGIDKIPEDGTWLLHKGERVVNSETSKKLDGTLNEVQNYMRSGNIIPTSTTATESKPVRGGDIVIHINGNFIGNNAATRDLAKIIKKEIHREETRIGAVN